jgi:hypothetical protein
MLSKLVVQEADNCRNREVDALKTKIKNSIKELQKLNLKMLSFDFNKLGVEEYDLLKLLNEKVDYIQSVDYEGVSQSEVVERALKNKKPFLKEEKGYRDTVIWLSFLNYLTEHKIEEDVVFISANKSDFFKKKSDPVQFHAELQSDIVQKKIKATIIPFRSLYDFVKNNIDKEAHSIDRSKSVEIFEDDVTAWGIEYIEGMNHQDLAHHLCSLFETKVKIILDITAYVIEGLEDHEILYSARIKNADFYVSYRYNLRIVDLNIDIPKVDYMANKEELDDIFFEAVVSDEIVTLSVMVRPYFEVSFIYNTTDEELREYTVEELWIKI